MDATADEQPSTQITVEREVAAPVGEVFALLVDPRRHPEIDGSGTVRAAAGAQLITAVGQSFVMDMDLTAVGHTELSDYQTENTVVELEQDALITWATARLGRPPAGVRWSYALREVAPGRTLVTHTYDWSRVTDPEVLARVTLPRIPEADLHETLARLAAAVEPR